jgi:peptidoglycan/xylan/chitin deacetylase (PgdA/CDA1 family)
MVAVSALVLLASLATAFSLNSGSVDALLTLFGATPTANMLQSGSSATGIPQQRIPYRSNYTPTATSTPPLIGDGAPTWSGTFPAYNGPIAPGQGCPGGQAPGPRSNVIRQASDYGAPKLSEVALTFDDGPTPYYSPAIISYLERTHTPATFFVLGQYAKAYPYLVQREAADGFAIGIHSWSHPDMTTLSPAQRAWQLVATAQQLHQDLGAGICLWLWRPPYGAYNGAIVAQAGQLGLTTINWSVDPTDWAQPGTQTIVNRVLAGARPGAIILMHDGPAGRAETLAALPAILAGLKARGLTPVTVPQLLLGAAQPTPTTPPTSTATPTQDPTTTPTATPTSPVDVPTPTDTPIL